MNYWQFTFKTTEPDILTAYLADFPFEIFEDSEAGLEAYAPESENMQLLENQLVELQKQREFTFSKTFHPSQNWNEIWESNFSPVVVEDWVGVRADFHEPLQNVQHEIVINPKMAFGTGHHETTWMCLRAMRDIDFVAKNVFDYGCGSGILAILADRLGATNIEAIDIEQESFLSTLENAELNHALNIMAQKGVISDTTGRDFDVILANINRNVILESIEKLADLTVSGGILVTSGFLKQDEPMIVEAAARHGFALHRVHERAREIEGGLLTWLCVVFIKHGLGRE